MTSLLSIVILVILAYSGSLIFQKITIKNTFLKSITFTGILYIILGFLLSPSVMNIFNPGVIEQLNIIFALVLGWAGFLIGLQTKTSGLKRFPVQYYRYSTINYLIVFGITYGLLYLILNLFLQQKINVQSLLVLSLAGAVTSPIMLAVVIRDNRVRARLAHLLQFQAAYDNLLGVFTIGIIVLVVVLLGKEPFLIVAIRGVVVLVVSIVTALVYRFLARDNINEEESFLYIIGLLLFLVGIALYLGMSILMASLIFGIVIANTIKNTRKLYHSIQQIEKPMYILLLIYVGINISFQVNYLIIISFFIIHIVAKIVAEYFANYTLKKNERHSGLLGFGSIGMGGLSLAIILDYYLANAGHTNEGLLLTIIIALLLQDGMALKYLEKRLVKKI